MGSASASDARGGHSKATATEGGSRSQDCVVPEAMDIDSSGYESVSGKMRCTQSAMPRGSEDGGKSRAESVFSRERKLHTIADIEAEDSNCHVLNLPDSVPTSLGDYSTIRDLDSPPAYDITVGDDDSMYATVRRKGAHNHQILPSQCPNSIFTPPIAESPVSAPPIYSIVKPRRRETGRGRDEGKVKDKNYYQRGLEEGGDPSEQVTYSMKDGDSKNTPTFTGESIERDQRGFAYQQALTPSDCTTVGGEGEEDRGASDPTLMEGLQISEGTAEEVLSIPPPLPPYTMEMNQLREAVSGAKDSEDIAPSCGGDPTCDDGDMAGNSYRMQLDDNTLSD